MTGKIVLAGDVGGTKTLLLLARHSDAGMEKLVEKRYASAEHGSMEDMLEDFLGMLDGYPKTDSLCLAVAGPVENGKAKLTNLPWSVDAEAIRGATGFNRVTIVNDFAAVAIGLDVLRDDDMVILQAGREEEESGTRLVLGAGTGLGVAYVLQDGRVMPTEGGHIGFAPVDEDQIELLHFLMGKYGRVSAERALSGRGITEIYRFLQAHKGHEGSPPLATEDSAAGISAAALSGGDKTAIQALQLFSSVYGAVAGDLALAGLATGGVYVAGGIASKILPFLQDGGFIRAFNNKGRFAGWTERVRVAVVTNTDAGLLGAAKVAAKSND
jgi:glucokinase